MGFDSGFKGLNSCGCRTGWAGNRIPVGLKLSGPVQTGPPESIQPFVQWVPGLFRGVKAAGPWH